MTTRKEGRKGIKEGRQVGKVSRKEERKSIKEGRNDGRKKGRKKREGKKERKKGRWGKGNLSRLFFLQHLSLSLSLLLLREGRKDEGGCE